MCYVFANSSVSLYTPHSTLYSKICGCKLSPSQWSVSISTVLVCNTLNFKPLLTASLQPPSVLSFFSKLASDDWVSWHPDPQSRTLALFSHSTKKYVQILKWSSPMQPPEPIFSPRVRCFLSRGSLLGLLFFFFYIFPFFLRTSEIACTPWESTKCPGPVKTNKHCNVAFSMVRCHLVFFQKKQKKVEKRKRKKTGKPCFA